MCHPLLKNNFTVSGSGFDFIHTGGDCTRVALTTPFERNPQNDGETFTKNFAGDAAYTKTFSNDY